MWPGLWFTLVMAFVPLENFLCNPVSTSFNSNIRSYSVKEADIDEIPDNAISGSAYSRGLLHHDHGGYGIQEYDDSHYSYGYDYDHHGLNHLGGHHGHHFGPGLGHGFHHKHYNPALAAKAILWPLAGLAILGTAAALVSNPVLLQLGVISGRRRRDTQEITGPDYDFEKWSKDVTGDQVNFKLDSKKIEHKDDKKLMNIKRGFSKRRVHKVEKQGVLSKKAYQVAQSTVESVTLGAQEYNGYSDEDFVPIPLKVKIN